MKNWKELMVVSYLILNHPITHSQWLQTKYSETIDSIVAIQPIYTSKNGQILISPWPHHHDNIDSSYNQELLRDIAEVIWKKEGSSQIYFIGMNKEHTKILIKVDNWKSGTIHYIIQKSWIIILKGYKDYHTALTKLK